MLSPATEHESVLAESAASLVCQPGTGVRGLRSEPPQPTGEAAPIVTAEPPQPTGDLELPQPTEGVEPTKTAEPTQEAIGI